MKISVDLVFRLLLICALGAQVALYYDAVSKLFAHFHTGDWAGWYGPAITAIVSVAGMKIADTTDGNFIDIDLKYQSEAIVIQTVYGIAKSKE